ncbi:MAG: DinB family protein [Gemmatimonadaceae bacterium]
MTSNPGTPETMILRDALRFLLVRDLRSLASQVAAYPDDGSVWLTTPGISNSAGNLVLHIVGNLRHFFGATLGSTGYVRNRESEFESRDLSREDLRRQIEATIEELETTLQNLDPERLGQAYPIPIADRQVRTGEFLAHLAVHLTYHLGQVDYHRRILTANPSAVENVTVKELPLAR